MYLFRVLPLSLSISLLLRCPLNLSLPFFAHPLSIYDIWLTSMSSDLIICMNGSSWIRLMLVAVFTIKDKVEDHEPLAIGWRTEVSAYDRNRIALLFHAVVAWGWVYLLKKTLSGEGVGGWFNIRVQIENFRVFLLHIHSSFVSISPRIRIIEWSGEHRHFSGERIAAAPRQPRRSSRWHNRWRAWLCVRSDGFDPDRLIDLPTPGNERVLWIFPIHTCVKGVLWRVGFPVRQCKTH